MAKKVDFDKYASALFSRTEEYADIVRKHYVTAVDELTKLAATQRPDGSSAAFSFDDNKRLSDKSNKILRRLYAAVYGEVQNGVKAEWQYANVSCDELIKSLFGKNLNEDAHFARWFSRNQEAMDTFLKRKQGGLNLSQRVWNYVDNLKTELEVAVSVSLGEGVSASTMSRRVRQYLQKPDDMFRRFRVKVGEQPVIGADGNPVTDAEGNVVTEPVYGRQWKKKRIDPQTGEVSWVNFNPNDYHTGRGVYRSSYKNAMRLTRTETNMAYRTAEHDRWQRLDFVVGFEVKTSANHPDFDICDTLKGRYPKTFLFRGWHAQCRCYCVPILATKEEFLNQQRQILRGEEPNTESVNEVKRLPSNFTKWVGSNEERILAARQKGTVPYFLNDNKQLLTKQKSMLQIPEIKVRDINLYDEQYVKKALSQFDEISHKNTYLTSKQEVIDLMEDSKFNNLDVLSLDADIQQTFGKFNIKKIENEFTVMRNGNIKLEWSNSKVQLTRIFGIDSDGKRYVHHDYFKIPEEIQGKGLSKAIFRDLYREYRKSGVEYMEVTANIDVGGYTWAKYGFCAKNKSGILNAINRKSLSKEEYEQIKKMVIDHFSKSNEPFNMRNIAELECGKRALLGGIWDGVLNLKDKKSREIFESYIGFTN